MGLFNSIFLYYVQVKQAKGYFQALSGYTPAFHSWNGALYESELVRSTIDARARHISKLKFTIKGSAKPKLQTRLKVRPNPFQTWSQFFYRLSTILDMQNTVFIVPILDEYGSATGIFPVLPSRCEFIDVNGAAWLRYTFASGQTAAIELARCGIMTKFQYHDDFIGEDNRALTNTMELINLQTQGIAEAVRSSAGYRFMARMANFASDDDLASERKRFSEKNFSSEAKGGGLLLFPNTYSDIKQIISKPYVVAPEQAKQIQTNVYNYFGANEKVLQNQALGDDMDAYFNGAIEPFCVQASEVLTAMLFSDREQAQGAGVQVSANRLQYMSVTTKVSMARDLGDRGVLLIDEIRELFNYEPLPDGQGQRAPIRGEYYMVGDERHAD